MPVTTATYRHIQAGNAARNHRDWIAAAAAYRAALTEAPGLVHIWVQYGHVSKETGNLCEAIRAYRRATELCPSDSDALLHLGHVLRMSGDRVNAARSYVRAVEADRNNPDAIAELHRIVAGSVRQESAGIADMLRTLVFDSEDAPSSGIIVEQARQALSAVLNRSDVHRDADTQAALEKALGALHGIELGTSVAAPGESASGTVFFDVSDLVGFFGHARLPTGIQRMQIEVIANRIATGGQPIRICCYNDDREGWLDVPAAQFGTLARLSLMSGDRTAADWIQAVTKLQLGFALSDPIVFPPRACLVTLGASWGCPNYFLALRRHRQASGLRYFPFVHDLVPIFKPEYHLPQLKEDFISWAISVFSHADGFLVNSEATKRDLLEAAVMLDTPVASSNVAVVRLDADFRKPARAQTRGIVDPVVGGIVGSGPFVLMVATLEPRKGHLTALQAWQELIRRHGRRRVPRLVCVGGKGWLNQEIHDLIAADAALSGCVRLLSNMSDDSLSALYRACLFTIYPSLYEGWGLPITEALCYGKPVITSDVSSLPEAGGEFAVYFTAGSSESLAKAVDRMSFDTQYREERAARIVDGFRPRTWQQVSAQLEAEVASLARDDRAEITRERMQLGKFYKPARTRHRHIWPGLRSGETIRVGNGWLWPEDWGCWTRIGGGEMLLALPLADGPLQVSLLLRNVPSHETGWTLQTNGDVDLAGSLLPDERRWISFEARQSVENPNVSIRICGDREEFLINKSGNMVREEMAAVGVEGVHVHLIADIGAETTFLKAATFGTLDKLDAYAEPSGSSDRACSLAGRDESPVAPSGLPAT